MKAFTLSRGGRDHEARRTHLGDGMIFICFKFLLFAALTCAGVRQDLNDAYDLCRWHCSRAVRLDAQTVYQDGSWTPAVPQNFGAHG